MDNIHHPNKLYRKLDLVAGKAYRIKVVLKDQHGDAPISIHWEEPDQPLMQEALQAANWADHVVSGDGPDRKIGRGGDAGTGPGRF